MKLHDLVRRAAVETPRALAVSGSSGSLSYAELDAQANRIAAVLRELGVARGDRVGLWHEKSIHVVAAMQGALRAGAAYVPGDPSSPVARVAVCIRDCACRVVVTDAVRAASLLDAGVECAFLLVDAEEAPETLLARGVSVRTWRDVDAQPLIVIDTDSRPDELAYILYTSGSTGTPKGVCLSHRNALAFVGWAADQLGVGPQDRLSSHAPFHFDLSVLDLYAAFWAGASVHLIPEAAAYSPRLLVELMQSRAITIWYSVPSVLMLMMRDGGLLERQHMSPHTIIFAGEVFPIAQLRKLQRAFPTVRLYNYYGPTETNVCTAYRVPELDPDETREIPIGTVASGDVAYAVRPDGTRAGEGEEGELWVEGPTVLLGYWGKAPQVGPYRTGDMVRAEAGGCFRYVGRIDNQVKVRGHRIELGEIETALRASDEIEDAAVVVSGSGMEAQLVAFIVPAVSGSAPSLVQIKRLCADRVPRYMIVDRRQVLAALPRTGNGKVDRAALRQLAARPEGERATAR
jgi:clorobiocin biosynthesis protein CloN4